MLEQIKNKHILVDADIVAYRCAAVAEKTRYLVETVGILNTRDYDHFENHKEAKEYCENIEKDKDIQFTFIWNRKEVQPLEFALEATKTTLDSFVSKLNPSKVSLFLSPRKNFRDKLAVTKPYKGNRDQPKPKYLQDVRDYLVKEHGAIICDGIEADDAIGIALSQDERYAVSVSIDKDLLQVPGWHYNWVNDRVHQVSGRDGDLAFYTQMLTGDATDNIPGLPGVGPKGAMEILQGVQSRADAASRVWNSYRNILNDTDGRKLGIEACREYFIEQANLLWILRSDTARYVCPIELK